MVLTPTAQFEVIHDSLNLITAQGGFTITVLTDENGFPIASSGGSDDSSEVQSAVVAQIQKMVGRVIDYLNMAEPEEVTLNDIHGKKLICRSFQASNTRLILAVLVPDREKTYRRLMNQSIRSIQKSWSE